MIGVTLPTSGGDYIAMRLDAIGAVCGGDWRGWASATYPDVYVDIGDTEPGLSTGYG